MLLIPITGQHQAEFQTVYDACNKNIGYFNAVLLEKKFRWAGKDAVKLVT